MSEKTQVEIRLVLPDVRTSEDACVKRIVDSLTVRTGVQAAHITAGDSADKASFCIHFDPARISLGEVRELVHRAGAELSKRFGHFVAETHVMHAREARTLEHRLQRMSGVLGVAASPAGIISIEFDREKTDESALSSAFRDLGVTLPDVQKVPAHDHDHDSAGREPTHAHGSGLGEYAELILAAASGGLLLVGWIVSFTPVGPWIPWLLYFAAYVAGGFFTVREAIENVRAGRFEIDFLMLVAAGGAAALGKWLEGALLLFLFSVGHSLEHYAMGRARRAIAALAALTPQTAMVRRNETVQEIALEDLAVGDIAIVKPNERLPADGFVLKGVSSVNQAPITGESVPVDKRAVNDPVVAVKTGDRLGSEHRVFAGTINGTGALEIQITRLTSESTLARVIQMVNEAETQKSPTQRFTEKFERYFVPVVIALAGLMPFSWLVIDEPFRDSFYRSMAVLVAASPRALAIATPSAVLSGVARAARGGVLIKGGGPLESLGTIEAIAFDKTGTLTEGKPRLVDVTPAEGQSEQLLLRVAVAVEALSDHPLAAAVVDEGRRRLGADEAGHATDLKSITGRGVQATVDGQTVHIGKDDLFAEIAGSRIPESLKKAIAELEQSGRTTMVVRQGETYLGVLGLMDTPRAAARVTVEALRKLGVKRMVMLSGDNQQVASAVAQAVGINEAWGDLMPDDKVDAIKRLRSNGGVAMIGDGVNDAPALANANVGVAMGAAGSDVALETADVALMADDLAHLPFAVGLSRKTSRIIRQNLWFSLGVVAFLLPATILGLPMGAAVVFHEGSTLFVVFNALRLLAYKPATN